MAGIKIRIGASLDRSVDAVFGDFAKKATRAADTIQKKMAGTGRGGPYRSVVRDAENAYSRVAASARRAADDSQKATEKSLAAQARAFKKLGDIGARELGRENRAKSAMLTRQRETFARSFGSGVGSNLSRIGSFGMRATGDILRGAGVDFNLGSSVARNRDVQTAAMQLSNSGFMRGKAGPAGIRQDPAKLEAEARATGDLTGLAPGAALSGLGQYVGKTGDLATGRAVLADMAKLAKATGADLDEMVAAAGDVGAAFGDAAGSQEEAQKRAEDIAGVMRVIAGQGKQGAVEIKDLASQMAKVSTSATAFEGDKSSNIATMGALAQMARQRGGAATANIAATSVASFVNTLRTPARASAFKDAGVAIEGAGGKFRDPQEIIIDAIKAAGTDTSKFKGMFANVQGARAVEGFRQTYLEAGGGAAGENAVRTKFKELGAGSAISSAEENESFNRAMSTSASKAQQFQNKLDMVVSSLAGKVLPELEKLAPKALELTKAFGDVIAWAAKNPGQAITAAIVASIAQAGLSAALRTAMEASMRGGVGTGVSGAGGVAGAIGSGLMIAAAAITITSVGMITIDKLNEVFDSGDKKKVEADIAIQNLKNQSADGSISKQQYDEAQRQAAGLRDRIGRAKQYGAEGEFAMGSAVSDYLVGGKSMSQVMSGFGDQDKIGDLEGKLASLERIMSGVKDGTLKVQVVNSEDFKNNGADQSNRQPRQTPFQVVP